MGAHPFSLFRAIAIAALFWLLAGVGASASSAHRSSHSHAHSARTVSKKSHPANTSAIYRPMFVAHDSKTPRFHNATKKTVNPLVLAAGALNPDKSEVHDPKKTHQLARRDDLPEGACAPGTPCVNGACCSKDGWCGYSPDFCGADSCISNCDAKASCGQYAAAGNGPCPLGVCCSKDGFCGTTDEFCGANCDNTFGGCGYPSSPSCSKTSNTVSGRRIGYYEGWAPTRPCDKRAPEDLRTAGLTHLNFAFAFFHPTTFQMTGMDAESVTLYNRFTALKTKQAGLQTWISVGGWSFNDETNVPNTRTAFSDMVSTAANRATFISSLRQFMITYNFDGVDLDWEYPGADDRGGRPEDRANFVQLLREMKGNFQGRFGISATLPSSYWYLQHFDLPGMEPYLDWFNIMSYDIHGVWDSSNVYAGPYVRPHTNLTEIDEGLQLLWRVGVNPSKVTLGLGWYGRSFTLSDPSCNQPWCYFTAGGTPGQCSGESGILSNAEIFREIENRGLSPTVDTNAAVAWVSWGDQWVSYDTTETMRLKMEYANSRCLGGSMIWAIDLDDDKGTSLGDLDPVIKVFLSGTCLYQGCNVGGNQNSANSLDSRSIYDNAQAQASCYTSFCNQDCAAGYSERSEMNGRIGYLSFDTTCPPGEYQKLCCADGSTYTSCAWQGYRGVGLPCAGGCSGADNVLEVARNTNRRQYDWYDNRIFDETCHDGFMSYCCTDFKPPPGFVQDITLLGADNVLSSTDLSLLPYDMVTSPLFCPDGIYLTSEGIIDDPLLSQMTSIYRRSLGRDVYYLCMRPNQLAGKIANVITGLAPPPATIQIAATGNQNAGKAAKNRKPPRIGLKAKYGQWDTYKPGPNDQDCSVTYTCNYGGFTATSGLFFLFDQVCDNQRYYLEKINPGLPIFHIGPGDNRKQVGRWKTGHKDEYRQGWFVRPGISLCEIEEFPMNVLRESRNTQALRAMDRDENNAQAQDFTNWQNAQYKPCSSLRAKYGKSAPPVTWTWAGIQAGDNREHSTGIIQKYGFDSTIEDLCWATYELNGVKTTVSDHGFRVQSNDPIFTMALNFPNGPFSSWPDQKEKWRSAPVSLVNANKALPVNVVSVGSPFYKRGEIPDFPEYFNTTADLLPHIKIARDHLYLDDNLGEICHNLDLWVPKEELPAWQHMLNEVCVNAYTTDSVPGPTQTGSPSRHTLDVSVPVTDSPSQVQSGFMTMTKFTTETALP